MPSLPSVIMESKLITERQLENYHILGSQIIGFK